MVAKDIIKKIKIVAVVFFSELQIKTVKKEFILPEKENAQDIKGKNGRIDFMIIRISKKVKCPECKCEEVIHNDEMQEQVFVICNCGKWCEMIDFRIKEEEKKK